MQIQEFSVNFVILFKSYYFRIFISLTLYNLVLSRLIYVLADLRKVNYGNNFFQIKNKNYFFVKIFFSTTILIYFCILFACKNAKIFAFSTKLCFNLFHVKMQKKNLKKNPKIWRTKNEIMQKRRIFCDKYRIFKNKCKILAKKT